MQKLAALLTILFFAGPALAESPSVATSIRPLHSLAANIMEGVGEPALIISGKQSEHTLALKPSDARKLANADIIFFISPAFETGFAKATASLAGKATTIATAKAQGIILLPYRDLLTAEDEHGDEHEHDDDHEHEHHHNSMDYHIWLAPENARLIAALMSETLAAHDPEHAHIYVSNLEKLNEKLAALDKEIKRSIGTPSNSPTTVPYITYHDAYQYFERHYGITPSPHITSNPAIGSGAKSVSALFGSLSDVTLNCVFSEPQFDARMTGRFVEETHAQAKVLDPIGSLFPDGKDNYFQMMRAIATSIASCLNNDKHTGQ